MSFLLFCLFITIFIFILNCVFVVTFWILIYYIDMNSVKYLLFHLELLNYSFHDMFASVLECYELTHSAGPPSPPDPTMGGLIMFSHSGFTVHTPAPQGVMHE